MHETINIVFLGGSTLDKVWNVNTLPLGGFKSKAYNYFEVGGGMAANAAVTAARLGSANTYFWGRAGNDAIGLTMKYQLEQYGINCQFFKLIDGGKSPVSAVIVDEQGERMIINYPGTELSHTPAWLPFYKLEQDKIKAVQADTRWYEGAKALFEQARILHIPTVLDIEKTPIHILHGLLNFTDYAIFSEVGLNTFIKDLAIEFNIKLNLDIVNDISNQHNYTNITKTLSAIAQRYNIPVIAVTKGDKGVFWLEQDKLYYQPAFKIKVVDTTGAGDAFHGAFTFAIANKYTTKKAMRFASAVAALKCTHNGGRGVPDFIQVEEFLGNQEQNN